MPPKAAAPAFMMEVDKMSLDQFSARTQLGRRLPTESKAVRDRKPRWHEWPRDLWITCGCGTRYRGDCYSSGHWRDEACWVLTPEDRAYYARKEADERQGIAYQPAVPESTPQLCLETAIDHRFQEF